MARSNVSARCLDTFCDWSQDGVVQVDGAGLHADRTGHVVLVTGEVKPTFPRPAPGADVNALHAATRAK